MAYSIEHFDALLIPLYPLKIYFTEESLISSHMVFLLMQCTLRAKTQDYSILNEGCWYSSENARPVE